MMAPGTSSMLRARRRDVNVKPNRRLDRKSSRGMLYENEELRLRTININAEVERGQNDIKKLRRENEQLRREIWGLREEYDRLEGLLGKAGRRRPHHDSDNGEKCEDEDEEYDEEEEEEEDDENGNAGEHSADIDNAENQQKASSTSSSRAPGALRVEFDGLSIVDEETDEDGDSGGRGEQQFLGKIKLPSGKEGVFLSDAAMPNGLPLYDAASAAAAAAAAAYDFGSVMGFGPGDYPAAWPELPNGGQGVVVFPPPQGHYNYTFTPVDADHDGYFGMRRGGPDLFISGAYPAARSPGVNLDQLLKQISDSAAADTARTDKDDAQEVIDALETQLGPRLDAAVRGVRVEGASCFVCLSEDAAADADALLQTGLSLRGERVPMQEAEAEAETEVVVSLSGVPHDVSDAGVAAALADFGTVVGDVERNLYKGVDTGQRTLRLRPLDADIPRSLSIAGSTVTLRTLPSSAGVSGATGDHQGANATASQPTFLDRSFSADRFRSQLNVRLKQPSLKTNRSLDNIFDVASDRKQHNTSLPIIDTSDSKETNFAPLKTSSDDKPASDKVVSSENLRLDLIGRGTPPMREECTTDHGQQVKPTPTEESREKLQEASNSPLSKETARAGTGEPKDNQSSPEIPANYTPNIFSKLPNRKTKCHNAQVISTTDDSTDSVDVYLGSPAHAHSNPFVGAFPTSSNNLQFPSYPARPVSPLPVNPFVSNQYQGAEQRVPSYASHYQPEAEHRQRVCSPYPHAGALIEPVTPGTSAFPGSHLNVSFRQSNIPTSPEFFVDPKIISPITNPTFPGSVGHLPGEVSVPTLQLPVASSSGNLQYFKVPADRVETFPPQTAPSGAHTTPAPDRAATADVPEIQPSGGTSSPPATRKHAAQQKPARKSGILSRQQSKSSGDEGPNPKPNPSASASPASRRKTSRRLSCTNSTGSLHNTEESSAGSMGWPTATSSPNTKHKASVAHHRKTSSGVAATGADAPGGGHANAAVDVSRSSSSGQDSPTKPDRRRRVSIYFNNKKGAGKRRDSVFVANGGSGGVLARSVSLDHADGAGAGAETTCSERERERTNSASSRTSSATLGMRKHSECSNRASVSDMGKVPWCGCWGNGCI